MRDQESRWYELTGKVGQPPMFVLGQRLTAGEQVLVAEADDKAVERSMYALSMEMIPLLLEDGEQPAKWMYDQAEAHRIGYRTFYRAAKALGVILERQGKGRGHQVLWRLPEPATPD